MPAADLQDGNLQSASLHCDNSLALPWHYSGTTTGTVFLYILTGGGTVALYEGGIYGGSGSAGARIKALRGRGFSRGSAVPARMC